MHFRSSLCHTNREPQFQDVSSQFYHRHSCRTRRRRDVVWTVCGCCSASVMDSACSPHDSMYATGFIPQGQQPPFFSPARSGWPSILITVPRAPSRCTLAEQFIRICHRHSGDGVRHPMQASLLHSPPRTQGRDPESILLNGSNSQILHPVVPAPP